MHGLSRHARRDGGASRRARARRHRPSDERHRGRHGARMGPRPFPGGRRRARPCRRAARSPHPPPARGTDGDHGPDRGRPAGGTGPRGTPPRAPPYAHPVQPARDRRRPGWRAAGRGRPRPTAGRDAVARAQPVAGVRGRVPHRPRLRPAPRGRCARSAPGAPGRGPAGARRGIRDRRPHDRQPVRGPCTQRRRRLRQGTRVHAVRPSRPRPTTDASEPGPPRRRLSRDGMDAGPRGRLPASDRRARRRVAARPVVVAGCDDRPRAGGGGTVDGQGRAGRPAGRRRGRVARGGGDRGGVGRLPRGRRTTVRPG